jgi:hypothetical protein
MFCSSLSEECTRSDIFEKINAYFIAEGIFWANCIGISAEEAATLARQEKGLRYKVQQIAPYANFIIVSFTQSFVNT